MGNSSVQPWVPQEAPTIANLAHCMAVASDDATMVAGELLDVVHQRQGFFSYRSFIFWRVVQGCGQFGFANRELEAAAPLVMAGVDAGGGDC